MSPAVAKNPRLDGDYLIVAWDLDTTGRRLIDEICHIGGYYVEDHDGEGRGRTFSQYVMPHGNPNPGARRSFGIKVVSVGRYRMLKDLETGRILKTKSEISALQDFIRWLEEAKVSCKKDGVLLACHEPTTTGQPPPTTTTDNRAFSKTRKVLAPLLLEALRRYNLMDKFQNIVAGFLNGVKVVETLGDKNLVTSYSLRSLCKTLLLDTNPSTASASDRCQVLLRIISRVAGIDPANDTVVLPELSFNSKIIVPLATTVTEESAELDCLKSILNVQGTLRPIFESRLRQRRSVRERAMELRKLLAASGMDYEAVKELTFGSDATKLKEDLRKKITDADDQELQELTELLQCHFMSATQQETKKSTTTDVHK